MAITDSKPVPQKNVAYHIGFPILDADGDLVAGATGLDSEVSTDSGGFADCASEAVQETTSSGMYELDLTAGEMNGDLVMVITKSTEGKTTPIVMYPEEAGDIRVNVTQVSGDATAADNAELFFDGTGYNAANSAVGTVAAVTTVNGLASAVITAASIATDAIGAAELAADAVAEIADAVWDEAMSGHLTLGTYGQAMRALGLTGQVNDVAPAAGSFILGDFTEATADHFNGMVLVFTSGALLGQGRVITDYAVTTQLATFAEAFTEAPANGDDYVIVPGSELGSTLAQVFRLFITILNAATGQLDAGSLTAGTIDAAAIATDAIDADALAANAVDEIWDEAMTESGGVPAVTASLRDAFRWMFALSRNKITQTATTQALRNDADAANIATAAVSDDGTTAIRNEWA